MLSQKPEHTAPLQQMPRDRLHIQQLTLLTRPSLHPKIIPSQQDQQVDRHAGLFRRVLERVFYERITGDLNTAARQIAGRTSDELRKEVAA